MLCEKCGAELPEGVEKCPVCEAEETADIEETLVEEIVETADQEEIAPCECKKSKKGLWIAVAAVVVVAIAAAVFGIASNVYYTTANDDQATVYTITKKDNEKVYAKIGNSTARLVKELGDNETFNENSEFVVKNNNIYYLNDEGGLSIMNMKNGKSREIGYDFKAGTIVFSAKGDTVLFVGEDGALYKSTKGRYAKEIAYVGGSAFENTIPNYGFVEGTNAVWYSPVDENYSVASVYLESGENVADKVSSVFYVGDDGKTVVYLAVTNEEIIEQEPAEGQEEAQPLVIRSYALMLKEDGKEPVVLNDNYVKTDSVSILHKEKRGVLYLADKSEPQKDPETGAEVGTAVGTLYFREFGGETIALDTEVAVALILDQLNGSKYWYDASDRAEDETIAYMKDNAISLIRDMKLIKNPKEFEFLSSTPLFAHENTFMIYKTYTPAPVTEEIVEGEETKETEQAPVKLVYTNLKDGAWTDYTVVAEDVVDYSYDEKNGKIYYLLDENDNAEKLVLYCYSVDKGEAVKIAEDVLGYMCINENGKDFYYVNEFNSETKTATISHYDGKKSVPVAKGLSGCLITQEGTPYIVVPEGENTDLYIVEGKKVDLVTKRMKNIIFGR